MQVSKSLAMLAGSFVVYVAVSCTSAALNDKDPKIEGVSVKDAIAELGVDADEAEALVDAVRDAFDEGAPTDARADPAPTSGTRLRVRYSVTKSKDGAMWKRFAGWYDSARKEPCAESYGTMTDGTKRCLPIGMATPHGFEDSWCTKPLFATIAAASCGAPTAPKYMTVTTDATCTAPVRQQVYAVAGEAVIPSTWYRRDGMGICTVATGTWPLPTPTWKIYRTSGEIAPTEFAEVTSTEETE